jgi:hypothetical protein
LCGDEFSTRPGRAKLNNQRGFMALSFAKDIRQLFRDTPDVEDMKGYGLDLSSYADVKARAHKIYETLRGGSMPCDEPWPKGRVAIFKQ